MNKHLLFVFIALLTTLASCKKDTIPTVSDKDLKTLNIQPVDFTYLSTRSKINFDNGKQKLGATANIRIRKDSVIWFSITPGFGIEAARGLVTQDSVFLVNKLQKEYYAYSFADLSRKLNVAVDYNVLQSALLGEPILPVTTSNRIRRTDKEVVVQQQQQGIDLINYFDNQTLKLMKVILQQPGSPDNLLLQYDNFQQLEGEVLPFSSTITAQYQDQQEMKATVVAFEHNKAEFSETALSFPFSIPDGYVRKK